MPSDVRAGSGHTQEMFAYASGSGWVAQLLVRGVRNDPLGQHTRHDDPGVVAILGGLDAELTQYIARATEESLACTQRRRDLPGDRRDAVHDVTDALPYRIKGR